MKTKSFLLLFTLLFHFQHVHAQDATEQKIKKLASSWLGKKSGGLIIGVRKGGLNKVYYFGETKPGTKEKPDNNSLFELGELTEIFTTTLYSELVFDKLIGADDPLQNFLPEEIQSPYYLKIICEPVAKDTRFDKDGKDGNAGIHFSPYVCRPDPKSVPQPVLLCYLVNHTSGLPEFPDNMNKSSKDPLAEYTVEELYSFLKDYQIINKEEFTYRYSLVGMGLLGHVMEKKSGMDYNDLLNQKIKTPLGLTSTFIYKKDDDSKLLTGFDSRGKMMEHMHYGVLKGSKGMCSTITDMMKTLEANMFSERGHLSEIFSYNQKSRIKLSNNNELALGWNIKTADDGNKLTWKQGTTNGFSSYIGFYKDQGEGVVILSSISKDSKKMGEEIIDLLR
ncbi:MAG: serine hydrolase [Bacteroidota bacterium]